MQGNYSFTREESERVSRLAEVLTTDADVTDPTIARADLTEFVHDVTAQELGQERVPFPTPPLSARKSYCRDNFDTVAAQNPGLSYGEARGLVAARWKALSKEERAPYKCRYKALKRQFKIGVAAYDARAKAYVEAGHGAPVSTMCHAEPECSISTISPRPPLQPTEPPADMQTIASSIPPGPLPQLTVHPTEPDLSTLTLSPRPPSQQTEYLDESEMRHSTEEMVERELGPRPTRPPHAGRLYCQAICSAIKEEFPGITWKDIPRVVNSRWKALSEEERQPFKDRYNVLMRQYKIDAAAYDARKEASLSTCSKPESTPFEDELERVLGPKPKRMNSSRDLYCYENGQRRRMENPGLCAKDARKGLTTLWECITKEERQLYIDRFQEHLRSYDADIVAYYERARALLISAYGELESSSLSDVFERRLGRQPKKPAPAHYQYFLDVYQDVKASNTGISYVDAQKAAASQWKAANKEVRQAYKDRFSASMEQFKIDSAAYEDRERDILKAAICKLSQPCESSTANTAQPVLDPVTDVPTLSAPPPPSQHLVQPTTTTGSPLQLSALSLPAQSMPIRSVGLPPSLPAPIESIGLSVPVGSFALSLAALPAGAASSDVAAPAQPLAISWPVEVSFSGGYNAPLPASANSGGLLGPSMPAEEALSSIPVTGSDPVAMAAANAVAPFAGAVALQEPVALVAPQGQPLSPNPPAPDVTSPASAMPAENVELPTLSKKKSKKKRRHAAVHDNLALDEGHRKKKKKKHKTNVIVKLENGTGEAVANKDNCQTDIADIVVKTET
ncbi:hypothetical protein LPJ60_000643 [Coemansia sp. RSA 2675]|nr:hypothetical protein LPJ60_000643 [Coemansia sp. RSA 2675]